MRVPIAGCIGYEPLGEAEKENLATVIRSGRITCGVFSNRLEDKLAAFFGVRHAILVNSGSSANLLAVASLVAAGRWRPGGEVITCAAAFPTTVAPLVQCGLVPVFVDAELPSHNANPDQVAQAISKRTSGIMLAHTLGFPFDDRIVQIARENALPLVEDCCDAAGAMIGAKHVGAIGDFGTLSFYPAHHMTTGEGGALLTSNDELAAVARSLRDWGRDCTCPPGCDNTCGKRFDQKHGGLPHGYDHKYVYRHLGYNLKMTEFQAAIGYAQIDRLPETIEARRANWLLLNREIRGGNFITQISRGSSSPFGFLVTTAEPVQRIRAVARLEAVGVQTRPLFAGNLLRHPAMNGVKWIGLDDYPTADEITERSFWVGVHPRLSDDQKSYMAEKLREALQ